MKPLVHPLESLLSPEQVGKALRSSDQPVLLRSGGELTTTNRYSIAVAFPFLSFECHGAQCEWQLADNQVLSRQFGNPWKLLASQLARYELPDEPDLPFPTGGCFGFWGYDLKQFVEPRVGRHAIGDFDFPDCRVGFYSSVIVWDHGLNQAWIIATGLDADGSRNLRNAHKQIDRWNDLFARCETSDTAQTTFARPIAGSSDAWQSSFSREGFLSAVRQALDYIRLGHIYQANVSQRWTTKRAVDPWELFERVSTVAPAPFSAFQSWDDKAIVSVSPEQFLHFSGNAVRTRPIKGTRPRSVNADEDARFAYELQASEKERAELVMITDLLRNDLGRVCEYGSIQVPDLMKLERFSHVHHLVSTVTGHLRNGVSHVEALAACFPGGSITGAPKVRAMQIIDELEPVSRGAYTGCLGYLGFNRESQLNILIRTAMISGDQICFHAGAGIVADSVPEAEYEETLVKARPFFQTLTPTQKPVPPIRSKISA